MRNRERKGGEGGGRKKDERVRNRERKRREGDGRKKERSANSEEKLEEYHVRE